MGKPTVAIDLTRDVEGLAGRRRMAQSLARRVRIVLLAAEGHENQDIGAESAVEANTVRKWRRRFAEGCVEELYDEPPPDRPREIGDDEIAETIRLTLETTPRGATGSPDRRPSVRTAKCGRQKTRGPRTISMRLRTSLTPVVAPTRLAASDDSVG